MQKDSSKLEHSNMLSLFTQVLRENVRNRNSEEAEERIKYLSDWEILKFYNTIHFMPYSGSFMEIIDSISIKTDNIILHDSITEYDSECLNVLHMRDVDENPEKIKPGILWVPHASETIKCWKKKESKFYDRLVKAGVNTIFMLG